ncbi:hypothetical protein C0989_011338 [Termitomyces sp. Mn162]|nr:hypothetical protein C0989_011338 [Termitomyces sp. Mn162]
MTRAWPLRRDCAPQHLALHAQWSTEPRLGLFLHRGVSSLPSKARHKYSPLKTFEIDTITTPAEFLKAIGRSSETKLEVDQWDALWKLSGHDLRQKGLAVRDRRYVELGKLLRQVYIERHLIS